MPPILSKDSANRAKYKIKKNFLYFYFRDAAYLIQRYIFYFISPKKITDFIERYLSTCFYEYVIWYCGATVENSI